jgi:hypothetical protein
MDDWRPATVDEVNEIVASDLKACDAEQLAAFTKHRVEPFSAPLVRYGKMESVVVVARNEEGAWMQAPIEVSPRGVEKCFRLTSSLIG